MVSAAPRLLFFQKSQDCVSGIKADACKQILFNTAWREYEEQRKLQSVRVINGESPDNEHQSITFLILVKTRYGVSTINQAGA